MKNGRPRLLPHERRRSYESARRPKSRQRKTARIVLPTSCVGLAGNGGGARQRDRSGIVRAMAGPDSATWPGSAEGERKPQERRPIDCRARETRPKKPAHGGKELDDRAGDDGRPAVPEKPRPVRPVAQPGGRGPDAEAQPSSRGGRRRAYHHAPGGPAAARDAKAAEANKAATSRAQSLHGGRSARACRTRQRPTRATRRPTSNVNL